MIKKVNKKAGFWIRLLTVLIDIMIFMIIGISSSLMCLELRNVEQINIEIYFVKDNYLYYLWYFVLILTLSIQFIVIPFLNHGKTIGMMITCLKIDYKENIEKKVILKKVEIGVLVWIFIIFLFMIFVRPLTINKMIVFSYVKKNFSSSNEQINELLEKNKWTTVETICYTIPSSLPPIVLIIHTFLLISTGFKNSKQSIIDKITNTQMIYSKKFDCVEISEKQIINPEKNIQKDIVWKE